MSTYFHPCKCQACGLHFGAFSWYETWKSDPDEAIACPECGSERIMKWAAVPIEGQIFEHVPGPAMGLLRV